MSGDEVERTGIDVIYNARVKEIKKEITSLS